jgi:hypothetical protein
MARCAMTSSAHGVETGAEHYSLDHTRDFPREGKMRYCDAE